jgi:hypothetical protein
MPRVVPSQVRQVIEKIFQNATKENHDAQFKLPHTYSSQVAAVVALADSIPDELLRMDQSKFAQFVAALESAKNALRTWNSGDSRHNLGPIQAFGDVNPFALIYRALLDCPDESPDPKTSELAFVNDPSDAELKDDLRIDISAAYTALSDGSWKAATVLAGSVMEALLLWRLKQDVKKAESANNCPKGKGKKSLPLSKWHLPHYIAVAEELNLIEPSTATLVKQAKDFRNLIHPGRSERLGQKCTRGTAHSTIDAMELVIEDVSRLTGSTGIP